MFRWLYPPLLASLMLTACSAASPSPTAGGGRKQWSAAPDMQIDPNKNYEALLKTASGDIVVKLLPKDAPIAVNNFVFLARQGYYQDVPVHRIVKGFVIQSGDPTGKGTGGPGYTIKDEPVAAQLNYDRGVVAMANTGAPNSAGSQFFITLADLSKRLPKNYVIFGQVTSGMDAVDKIAATPVIAGAGGEESTPTTAVKIDSVEIRES